MGKGDLDDRGLYELMRSKGINIAVANQRITARKGSASECELLGIDKGAAVLTMERTAYNEQGRAVEWGRHCYRPDLYSFEITLVDK